MSQTNHSQSMGKFGFPVHLGTSSAHWALSMFSQISVQLFTYLHTPIRILKTFFLNHFSVLVNSTISCNRELHRKVIPCIENYFFFRVTLEFFIPTPSLFLRQLGGNKPNTENLVEEAKPASILPHKGKHLVVKNLKEILIMAAQLYGRKELSEVSGKSCLSLDVFGCIAVPLHM